MKKANELSDLTDTVASMGDSDTSKTNQKDVQRWLNLNEKAFGLLAPGESHESLDSMNVEQLELFIQSRTQLAPIPSTEPSSDTDTPRA